MLLLAASAAVAWIYFMPPTRLSGAEFEDLFKETGRSSAGTWVLVDDTGEDFELRYGARFIPRFYVVSKRDIDLRNGRPGALVGGYVYNGDVVLRTDSTPPPNGQK